MIYSPVDLTGEELPQLPFTAALSPRLRAIPSAKHTHTRTSVFFFLQVLFMFEWSGLCVFSLPCPLKRALINGCFINQEVLAGSKRLWGQGSAEVLNQFPNLPWLDIFCFLAARRFIIILPLRHNGRGIEGGLDVVVSEEDKKGNKEERGMKCSILSTPPPPFHVVSSFFLTSFTWSRASFQLKSLHTQGALYTCQTHLSTCAHPKK